MSMRTHADTIIQAVLKASQPDEVVGQALAKRSFPHGRVLLLAIGKAAWQMASCARSHLGDRVEAGIVITKYGHSKGHLPGCEIIEAGHPIPDANSCRGAETALRMVSGLAPEDTVIFLVSGGGSALFELPLIPMDRLAQITDCLLRNGADIREINTVRKRFSAVKGGRFAKACAPAQVYSIILSDVLGDPLDMIASGPTVADTSTKQEAIAICEKYGLELSPEEWALLQKETPKALPNSEAVISGSVRGLCEAASAICRELGYRPTVLTDRLCCEAREAGSFLGSIAASHAGKGEKLAFIAGGETVVHVTGPGLGGRNQELALGAAEQIAGCRNVLIFSLGSDGTDGPTDAAGGMVDGDTGKLLKQAGLSVSQVLKNNDAYHALQKIGGLIITGPTGTNVNDVSVALIQ